MSRSEFQFSIIIPVYNASEFLERCLNSILEQSFKDFEVICVNDDSTDNSLEILEKYAEIDKRVKVYSQKKQGVSAARNLGIENAKGEYILFCDSDDKFKPYLCSTVASVINREEKDVIAFGHENYVNGVLEDIDVNLISQIKKTNKFDNWLNLQVYIWEKSFKRSFIEKNNIRFPVGIKNAEDLIFCLSTYFSGAKYSLVEKALYEYTKECNGKSTFSNPDGIKNDTEAYKYLINTKLYKELSFKEQLAVTNFFIRGSNVYYKTLKDTTHSEKIISDLKNLYLIILNKYSLAQCLRMKSFRRMYKVIFKDNHKKFFAKFDIITTPTTRFYIVWGAKFAVKRKIKQRRT